MMDILWNWLRIPEPGLKRLHHKLAHPVKVTVLPVAARVLKLLVLCTFGFESIRQLNSFKDKFQELARRKLVSSTSRIVTRMTTITTRLLTVYHAGTETMVLADGSFGKHKSVGGGGLISSARGALTAGVDVLIIIVLPMHLFDSSCFPLPGCQRMRNQEEDPE
jgi:hypothetical protein